MKKTHILQAAALGAALFTSAAFATPYTVTSTLTGDYRTGIASNLGVDLTITGDDTTNTATWTVSLNVNQAEQPSAFLGDFYFNLANAGSYTFSGISPAGWTVSTPNNTQGLGGVTPKFDYWMTGPANTVTSSQDLIFTITSASNLSSASFLTAPTSTSSTAGFGNFQIGAHIQGLNTTGGLAGSGFVAGGYTPGGGQQGTVPEPSAIALLGMGLLAVGASRIGKNR